MLNINFNYWIYIGVFLAVLIVQIVFYNRCKSSLPAIANYAPNLEDMLKYATRMDVYPVELLENDRKSELIYARDEFAKGILGNTIFTFTTAGLLIGALLEGEALAFFRYITIIFMVFLLIRLLVSKNNVISEQRVYYSTYRAVIALYNRSSNLLLIYKCYVLFMAVKLVFFS